MTSEEFKNKLTEIASKPDSMQAELPAFIADVEKDYANFVSAVEKITAQDEKIRTLQDTNTRLFLMQTGGSTTAKEEEEELQGTEAVDAFVKEIMSDKKGENE